MTDRWVDELRAEVIAVNQRVDDLAARVAREPGDDLASVRHLLEHLGVICGLDEAECEAMSSPEVLDHCLGSVGEMLQKLNRVRSVLDE